ncbi:MAG: hypothetical protein WD885_01320 [Candidatus Saccharimonadales bacterium]
MTASKQELGGGAEADRQSAASFYGAYDQDLDELIDSLSAKGEVGKGSTPNHSPVLPIEYGQAATGRLPSTPGETGNIQTPEA